MEVLFIGGYGDGRIIEFPDGKPLLPYYRIPEPTKVKLEDFQIGTPVERETLNVHTYERHSLDGYSWYYIWNEMFTNSFRVQDVLIDAYSEGVKTKKKLKELEEKHKAMWEFSQKLMVQLDQMTQLAKMNSGPFSPPLTGEN